MYYYASSVFVSQRPIACWGSAPIPLNDAVSIELIQRKLPPLGDAEILINE